MLGPPGAHLGFRPPSGALAWVSRSALATQGPRVTLSPWPCPQKQLGTSRLDEATPRQLPRPLGVMSLPPGLQWVGQVGAVGQVSRRRSELGSGDGPHGRGAQVGPRGTSMWEQQLYVRGMVLSARGSACPVALPAPSQGE